MECAIISLRHEDNTFTCTRILWKSTTGSESTKSRVSNSTYIRYVLYSLLLFAVNFWWLIPTSDTVHSLKKERQGGRGNSNGRQRHVSSLVHFIQSAPNHVTKKSNVDIMLDDGQQSDACSAWVTLSSLQSVITALMRQATSWIRSVDRRIFKVHSARKTMTANQIQTQSIDRRFRQFQLAREKQCWPMMVNPSWRRGSLGAKNNDDQ